MSLIGILVLAAAPVAADTPASDPTTGQCQVLGVRPVPRSTTRPERTGARSARDVVDLHFETRLRPGAEADAVELRIYTPGGHLYRKLAAAVSREEAEDTAGIRRRRPSHEARAVMPVGGTGIVRNGLYGKWKAVPYLAGQSRPCGRAVSFELAP